jgi:signal peptidase I
LDTRESLNSRKDQKKKTCWYYGKDEHVEKTYWKKSIDLGKKVKKLEGDVIVVR